MCPTEDAGEQKTPRRRPSWSQTNPEAAAEYRRRYREAHPEKMAALDRAWRQRNLERSRELNRESAKRQAQRRRQRLKRNAHGREWYAENRNIALARSRLFRAEHPEKVREYQRRYKERHPERKLESGRRSAQRHRDANADEIRARQQALAAARREQNPDEFKQWYQKNIEVQRARGREASRRRSRLKTLGLPPRRIHGVYAEERRAHDAAANEYFARRRTVAERGAIAAEATEERPLDLPKVIAVRRRVVLRAQSAPFKTPEGEPLVNGQDRGLPPEVLQWRRARDLQALKESHERLVEKIRAERPQIYTHRREWREARLREEIRMDSIARTARGMPSYEMEQETQARLDAEVTEIVNRRLATIRNHTIQRAEAIVRRREIDSNSAAPHRTPGAGPNTGRGLQ